MLLLQLNVCLSPFFLLTMYQCQTTLQAFAQIRDGVPDDAEDLLRGDPAFAAIYNMLERLGGRGAGRGAGRGPVHVPGGGGGRGAGRGRGRGGPVLAPGGGGGGEEARNSEGEIEEEEEEGEEEVDPGISDEHVDLIDIADHIISEEPGPAAPPAGPEPADPPPPPPVPPAGPELADPPPPLAAPPVGPEPADPLEGVITDGGGFVRVRGRPAPIGRITSWDTSVSAQCKLHSRCRRPYYFRQTPAEERILEKWLLAGIALPTAEAHMALPKPTRSGS